MTPDQYRAAIAALNLSQVGAAKALGINIRTSRRYAKTGVSPRMSRIIATSLARLSQPPSPTEQEGDL